MTPIETKSWTDWIGVDNLTIARGSELQPEGFYVSTMRKPRVPRKLHQFPRRQVFSLPADGCRGCVRAGETPCSGARVALRELLGALHGGLRRQQGCAGCDCAGDGRGRGNAALSGADACPGASDATAEAFDAAFVCAATGCEPHDCAGHQSAGRIRLRRRDGLTARKNRRAERHSFYELTGRGTACKLFIVVQRFIIDMQVHFNSLVSSSRQSDLSCCCCPSIQ
jgi:hypothetical protein